MLAVIQLYYLSHPDFFCAQVLTSDDANELVDWLLRRRQLSATQLFHFRDALTELGLGNRKYYYAYNVKEKRPSLPESDETWIPMATKMHQLRVLRVVSRPRLGLNPQLRPRHLSRLPLLASTLQHLEIVKYDTKSTSNFEDVLQALVGLTRLSIEGEFCSCAPGVMLAH